MLENFVKVLSLNDFLSNAFTLSLLVCLLLHLTLTKQKRLVSFCMFLVIVQFFNWWINPTLIAHEMAIYLWYVTWMVTDVAILFYVAYKAVVTRFVIKEEFAVSILTAIAIAFSLGRYIERHFTEFTFIKDIQGYALTSVNICIVLVLAAPIVKQLAFAVGRYLNGITVFGFRFSVSRVQSHATLKESGNPQKRKYL